ncbi:MAG TPA: dienelactone hydrolase family protein [Aliidongia sp.]|uniref:dienelactone hydrolase family protein n=1 Tax=Aliidongia sp. TaxID=1914230 RepID=UPI002DDCC359|nr:dienelactone hydrolase family protein [Aliidongia sp.]HEV2675988.1 dienelactone hydrolase family protein [Aliidongia sp.]
MGTMISLTAADGHGFGAYKAGPDDAAMGLVVIQEIFGVNGHIRDACDRFAAQGFSVVAPALFDRADKNAQLGYTQDDVQAGLALRAKVSEAAAIADIAAAALSLGGKPIGIIGYCWGGTLAWHAASKTQLFKAGIGWYGGGIPEAKDAILNCPVQLHFGETDHGIPLDGVEAVKAAHPEVEVFVYDGAGHGFGCDQRASYDAVAYAKAQERSLAFLKTHLGQTTA